MLWSKHAPIGYQRFPKRAFRRTQLPFHPHNASQFIQRAQKFGVFRSQRLATKSDRLVQEFSGFRI